LFKDPITEDTPCPSHDQVIVRETKLIGGSNPELGTGNEQKTAKEKRKYLRGDDVKKRKGDKLSKEERVERKNTAEAFHRTRIRGVRGEFMEKKKTAKKKNIDGREK